MKKSVMTLDVNECCRFGLNLFQHRMIIEFPWNHVIISFPFQISYTECMKATFRRFIFLPLQDLGYDLCIVDNLFLQFALFPRFTSQSTAIA